MDWFVQVFSSPFAMVALYACCYILGRHRGYQRGHEAAERSYARRESLTLNVGDAVLCALENDNVAAVTVTRSDQDQEFTVWPERLPS
ncbi:hypothetical protein [Propionimicrobium sp. PCR01-08-3]|uniref:hypothetical protein n=1 Tax=Propionimicrobium sp. PCR01-08-3 TaxID=3052086 RepID=UPI00255CE69A|nr:hypothetical protein [Propionimicrobium sp. PCR01-08-3]WIY84318.1 hypothetical protein QQ658_15265 [Propionimicrobium sp. PCR01-08-3]